MKAKLITLNFASLTLTKTQSEKSYRKITPKFTAQWLTKELSRFWATCLTLVSTLSMVMALFQKIKVTCNSQRQSIWKTKLSNTCRQNALLRQTIKDSNKRETSLTTISSVLKVDSMLNTICQLLLETNMSETIRSSLLLCKMNTVLNIWTKFWSLQSQQTPASSGWKSKLTWSLLKCVPRRAKTTASGDLTL